MHNSAVKKYIPVYERTQIERVYSHFPHDGKDVLVPKYSRGDVDFWFAIPTTKAKIAYTMLRLWRRRVGQIELIPILTGNKSKKKQTVRMY